MFGDIQIRADRMKRLPPVTLKDYVPLLGEIVGGVVLAFVFVYFWHVVTPFVLSII